MVLANAKLVVERGSVTCVMAEAIEMRKCSRNQGTVLRSLLNDHRTVPPMPYGYGDYVNGMQQPFVMYAEFFFPNGKESSDVFLPMGTGVFGKGTDMLPVSATSDNLKYEFSYTYNTDGSIKTQTVTNGSRSVELNYAY